MIALLLGTVAFAGLGLLLAGALRAEATLALANGLFLAALMLGGIVLPLDHLADPLAAVASVLPAAALADTFRVALGSGGDAVGRRRDPGRLGHRGRRAHGPDLPLGVDSRPRADRLSRRDSRPAGAVRPLP